MKRIIYISIVVLALLLAASCTVQDGEPWGWLEADASAAGALVEPGGSPAPNVSIETADAFFDVRLVETRTSSAGSGAGFDPASPPPGYTFCHNGHCHSEGGDLVPYDDVREELANSGGTTAVTVARLEGEGTLGEGAVDVGRAAIESRAEVDSLEVQVNLEIRGTVTLDETDYELVILTSPFTMTAPANLSFGPGEPYEQSMNITLNWAGVDALGSIDLGTLDRSSNALKITQVVNRGAAESIVSALREGTITLTNNP